MLFKNWLKENKQKKRTATDVVFQKTVCHTSWNVRTQEVDQSVSSWDEVEGFILEMMADEDEFVTLTTGDVRHHICYVQAVQNEKGIIVQVGIEEGEQVRLVEKICSQKECMDIFREFYASSCVQGLEKYSPVEFFI